MYDDISAVLDDPCTVLEALHEFATASTLAAADVSVLLGRDILRQYHVDVRWLAGM